MVVIFVGKYPYNSTIYLKVDGHGTKFQFDQKKILCLYQKKILGKLKILFWTTFRAVDDTNLMER